MINIGTFENQAKFDFCGQLLCNDINGVGFSETQVKRNKMPSMFGKTFHVQRCQSPWKWALDQAGTLFPQSLLRTPFALDQAHSPRASMFGKLPPCLGVSLRYATYRPQH